MLNLGYCIVLNSYISCDVIVPAPRRLVFASLRVWKASCGFAGFKHVLIITCLITHTRSLIRIALLY
jgi:hypothetical protein